MERFHVIDCEFNRAWYSDMIGMTLPYPPGYAAVEVIQVPDDVDRELYMDTIGA